MDKSTRIVRLQRWSAEVAACNQSGMSKGDWCRENGVNPKTFYYHQRMVRRAAFEALPISAEVQEVHFLEIPKDISAETNPVPAEHESASAVIHIGDVQISLIRMGAVVRNKAKVEPLTRVKSLSLLE